MKGRVVLVVDDDDMIRRLVRTVLEADDFEVTDAEDGPKGLELIESLDPDLVILDIMMPGMSGVEVCRRIDHAARKVVILTARDDPSLQQETKEAGADAFLTKPFSSIELLDMVETLTDG
jgi:DNA-binding response OmpR family regulator